MSRAPSTFRQSDLARALRAADAAGKKVKIKITRGSMEIIPIEEGEKAGASTAENAGALDAWRAGRDDQG
jgi:hypothetical protein